MLHTVKTCTNPGVERMAWYIDALPPTMSQPLTLSYQFVIVTVAVAKHYDLWMFAGNSWTPIMDTRVLFIEFDAIHSCLGAQRVTSASTSLKADRTDY